MSELVGAGSYWFWSAEIGWGRRCFLGLVGVCSDSFGSVVNWFVLDSLGLVGPGSYRSLLVDIGWDLFGELLGLAVLDHLDAICVDFCAICLRSDSIRWNRFGLAGFDRLGLIGIGWGWWGWLG